MKIQSAQIILGRLLMVTCIGMSVLTMHAATYHATPDGSGGKNGSDWANAFASSQIQTTINSLAPGDALLIGSGTYSLGSLTLVGDGTSAALKQITGTDTGGGMPVFKGTYIPGVASGGSFIRFSSNNTSSVKYWTVKNLIIRNYRYAARMSSSGTTYTLRTNLTFENIVCESVEDGFGIYNSSNITLRNCTVTRYTKKAFRISTYSCDITLERCYTDCNGGDDTFPSASIPTGFCCDDTSSEPIIHDISFIDCVSRNNRFFVQADTSYWNGDGFTSERGTYNLLFLRCESYNNHDGGFDNKADTITYRDCVAAGNKRGFRHWGAGGQMENCVAANNTKFGGNSSSTSLWVSRSGGELTVRNSTFHNAANTQLEIESGGTAYATFTNCLISTDSANGTFATDNAIMTGCATYKPGSGTDPQYIAPSSTWRGIPVDAMDNRLYGATKGYNSVTAARPANVAPSLSISGSPLSSATAPLTVSFRAVATDSDGVVASLAWDFGNGETSFDENPTVTFSSPGDYTVTCSAIDNRNTTVTQTLQISVAPLAPRISQQPQNVQAGLGSAATFSVTATGDSLAYQWLRRGNPIAGATTATLTLPNIQVEDMDTYTVTISNASGSITSHSATLTVVNANGTPLVLVHPVSATASVGENIFFNAVASGNDLAYQWTFNSNAIATATTATLNLDNIQPTQSGGYAVIVTNTVGATTSATATLTVQGLAPAGFTTLVPTQTVANGHSVNLTAQAQGTPAPTYQWMLSTDNGATWQPVADNATYSGAQTNALTIQAATAAMNKWKYRCAATNYYGTLNSATTTLNVIATLLAKPVALALDTAGNIYVADATLHTVQTIAPSGTTTLLAGRKNSAGMPDGTGTAAQFNTPGGVAITSGTLLVADTANALIRTINASGATTTLIAASAGLALPAGVVADTAGNIYIADTANHVIRRRAPDGTITIVAGAKQIPAALDSTGTLARLNSPAGIALGGDGNLYIADTGNHSIRRLSTTTWVLATLAGALNPSAPGSTDGTGTAARFNRPQSLITTGTGAALRVHVADTGNSTIREITPAGTVTTIAGCAGENDLPGNPGLKDGTGTNALFNFPSGIAVDNAGNLWVVDTGNAVIRKIDTSDNVTTLALTEYISSTTPPPNPPAPTSDSNEKGGGGGGAPSLWMLLATALLVLAKKRKL